MKQRWQERCILLAISYMAMKSVLQQIYILGISDGLSTGMSLTQDWNGITMQALFCKPVPA